MSDQLELQEDRKQSKEELGSATLTPEFGPPPSSDEVNALHFSEQSKKVATDIENQTASQALQVREIKQEVVQEIILEQISEIDLDTKMTVPDNLEELRAAQAKTGKEINKKVKENLGHNSGVSQAEARLEAWRKRDVNKEIDINKQIKAKALEDRKMPTKSGLKDDKNNSQSILKKALDGPSLVELLVTRILEVLGLKPKPDTAKEEEGKDENNKARRSRRRKENEPLMKRILKAIGLIP
jgi:hypothetical protein